MALILHENLHFTEPLPRAYRRDQDMLHNSVISNDKYSKRIEYTNNNDDSTGFGYNINDPSNIVVPFDDNDETQIRIKAKESSSTDRPTSRDSVDAKSNKVNASSSMRFSTQTYITDLQNRGK